MAAANMTIVGDKREILDRRIKNQPLSCHRRVRPDRRLNNIYVEWIPNNEIVFHPPLFKVFMKGSDRK